MDGATHLGHRLELDVRQRECHAHERVPLLPQGPRHPQRLVLEQLPRLDLDGTRGAAAHAARVGELQALVLRLPQNVTVLGDVHLKDLRQQRSWQSQLYS